MNPKKLQFGLGVFLMVVTFALHAQQIVAPKRVDAISAEILTKAEAGDVTAQNQLGNIYCFGIGVEKNKAEAVKWYRKAAEQNDADSLYELGCCYSYGEGVVKDEVEAVKWYRKAAEQNHGKSKNILGDCCHRGQGVEKDDVEAVKWYRQAAEQNYVDAQKNLGNCYGDGQGVAKDLVEAVKWLHLAMLQGNRGAKNFIPRVEKGMTPEQIAEGERRATEWLEQWKSKHPGKTRNR